VAAPDARLGQVPVAAVEPAPGAEPTAAELRDWVRSHLEPYKVPTAVVLVAELPRNAALKPDRQAILALLP
jgi:acyl-CoA synthetase (AMP-forming)/AMP-acid ligase II